MEPLLTAAQTRSAEQFAIDHVKFPDTLLMEHAALAVARAIKRRFGRAFRKSRGLILVGPGNNGGDALAAARLLHHRGVKALHFHFVSDPSHLSPASALQLRMLENLGVPCRAEASLDEVLAAADWVIDGIFGTGLARPVEGEAKKVIAKVNAAAGKKWIVAVDIPSGLSADTGLPLGSAIKASETVTFGFMKRGLVTGDAADHTGRLRLATIQIPRKIPGVDFDGFWYGGEDVLRLPERWNAGHKGNYGHVFVWAGEPGKQGACSVSARGALRSGVGLVTVVGKSSDIEGIRPRLIPEVMTAGWDDAFLSKDFSNAVAAVGPGMGTDDEALRVLETFLKSSLPLVLDADALNVIASHCERILPLLRKRAQVPTIFTPHPKEAGRLLNKDVADVQADRYRAAREIVETFGVFVVLKGKGSIIASPRGPFIVVTAGDSGLSKGGTGDLLTGIVGSLMAQGLSPEQALPLAAYLHGRASELVTESFGHERSTLASDIAEMLPVVFKELECRRRG